MSSTPKKRTKVKRNPNSDVGSGSGSGVDSSVSSSSLLLKSIKEPPRDFFPSKDDLAALITVLIIACFVFVSCNFFVSRLSSRHPIPFCDTDADSSDFISDVCEPCPRHGECRDGKLECLHGYRKHGRLCIEDGVINEAVNKLSEWLESHLCEANAKFLCDGIGIVWVKENDIWDDLDGKELVESIGSDNTTLMYAKSKALETIGGLLQTRQNSLGIKELKCPDLLAESYKPFTCRIRHWVLQHAFVVLPVFLLLVGCTWLLWKLYRRQYLTNRAEDLYNQVCEILEENALTSTRNSGQCESWVVASRLRDHLLLPRERRNPLLWKKVEELVQEDSRIDRYPRLVKGDGKEVWEWQVEGSLSSSMKKKLASKSNSASKSNFWKAIGVNPDPMYHKIENNPKAVVL
ncbi:uncharacterized protein LOC101208017 isoform X1 [Cucumis sativus]|uniref:Man1/Src1-like C-terminal domain-containing protein n=1 Tax=Cucumis sativus TaxID=3659 RepID=A0A0A0LI89_CUCSA|nr:uncharacterized protein LOC101208017 isoform X1 [Cucumis sativus]KGN60427.1 hypothetical protein Csa_002483 [Cucumis sativus]